MMSGVTSRRRLRRVGSLSLALFTMLAGCRAQPRTPESVSMQFYTLLDALGIRRVPDETQWRSLQGFLADSLYQALGRAREARTAAASAHPDDKPPFADGDPFSSLFEGRTSFQVVRAIPRGDTTLVLMQFMNDTQKPRVEWQDTVVVVTTGGTPRVADIRYGTTWEFGFRGRLLDVLAARP